MGDISEMKGVVFIASFVGSLMLLMIWAPGEIYSSIYGEPNSQMPKPSDVMSWNGTYVWNMSYGMDETIVLLNRNMQLAHSTLLVNYLTMWTFDYWGFIYWNEYSFSWYQNNIEQSYEMGGHQHIDLAQIDTNYLLSNITGLDYVIDNTLVQFEVSFRFNTTNYTSPSNALADDALQLVINYDFDDRSSSMNAINVIGLLFFGQLPGVELWINAMIALGLWACSAYLVFIFVLRVVGAVFGGGGA